MKQQTKTIRLLYPDYVSGGLDCYYLGAKLMERILPENEAQKLVRVNIEPPSKQKPGVTGGMYGRDVVLSGIKDAMDKITAENPDKIITIGGSCMVSQAAFDYLHGKYPELGIIWIDAHPDVSTPADGYPNAHAMILGSLLGSGDSELSALMQNPKFKADEILYVGLQALHDYQQQFLDRLGVNYQIQTSGFVTETQIQHFAQRFERVLVHFDIDVLDAGLFHDTYFANPALVGDGSGGGKMTMEQLAATLNCIQQAADIVGFTVAEYLPFEAQRLRQIFEGLSVLTEG